MKIALFTNGIWPYVIGGMQKHSYFLCKHLAKNKVEVLLVHTAKNISEAVRNAQCFTEEERKFIKVITIPTPSTPAFPGHYIYQSYLYSKKIYEKLGGFPEVDFIIAKGMTGWYFQSKKKNDSPPIGINIHGYEFLQRKANFKMKLESYLLKWPLTLVNRKADFVFSYGGGITEYIRQLRVPEKKIIEIPAAIEKEWMTASIKPAGAIRRFVFVGRLERRKGIDELHTAIRRLLEKYSFEFHFVGPVPESMQIAHPNLVYHGPVHTKEQMQDILQQSHILVCPSYAEGMPNVILEGMANGCTVIATDVGAVSLMVDQELGWLIPAADEQALENALEQAIRINADQLEQKRKLSVSHIQSNFLWESVIQKTIISITNKINSHG